MPSSYYNNNFSQKHAEFITVLSLNLASYTLTFLASLLLFVASPTTISQSTTTSILWFSHASFKVLKGHTVVLHGRTVVVACLAKLVAKKENIAMNLSLAFVWFSMCVILLTSCRHIRGDIAACKCMKGVIDLFLLLLLHKKTFFSYFLYCGKLVQSLVLFQKHIICLSYRSREILSHAK